MESIFKPSVVAGVLTVSAAALLVSQVARASSPRGATQNYARQASTICHRAQHQVSAVPRPLGTAASLAAMFRSFARIEGRELRALRKLSPPAQVEPLVRQGLRYKAIEIRTFESIARDLLNGSLSIEQALPKAMKLPDHAALWRKAGAASCKNFS